MATNFRVKIGKKFGGPVTPA